MSNTRKKVVHPPMCICVICDAEAAVIAAAEAQEQAMTALAATDDETASSVLDTLMARCEQAASYVMLSVRALHEARKP